MGWLFVPELAGLSEDLNWPSEMPIGVSLGLNGKPLRSRSWSRASRTNMMGWPPGWTSLAPLVFDSQETE